MAKVNRNGNDLLSPRQFAEALGVSDRTFRRYRTDRKLPAPTALPGRLFWRRDVVEAFISKALDA